MGDHEQGNITREVQDKIFLIGINRPAKRNAFTWHMLGDFCRAYTEYEANPELRCAVVFAHGDHFTAGLDLADVAPYIQAGDNFIPQDGIDPLALYGKARSKPVIFAVKGYCMTVGIEFMLAADVVVAASDARFQQIEIKRGIYPFGGATIRMVHAAGWGNAMRYLLTGDEIRAAEAYRIGLVQEVTEPGRELDRAVAIARTVAAQAPLGVQATLDSARTAVTGGFHEAANKLVPKVMELMQTADAQEGLMSMIERRPAVFKGR
ncbi:MAG: crotonase/enoyl-CoA hydratase family protein [Deltaproteobacteria bacterium]|nr:crotonase/enoyl-CoA hydratase family protein [Deltaproteobacteria bacterium]